MKPSTYYFHMKTKILAGSQTCISVPLSAPFYQSKWLLTIQLALTYVNLTVQKYINLIFQNRFFKKYILYFSQYRET